MKTKRALVLILVLIMASSLMAGCSLFGGQNDQTEKNRSAAEKKISQSREAAKKAKEKRAAERNAGEETEKKKAAEKKKASEAAEGEKAKQATGKGETDQAADQSSKNKKAKSGKSKKSKEKSGSSASSGKSGKSSASSSTNSSTNSSTAKQKTCTIKITCGKLVGNKDLDDGQRSRVPSDGVIMSASKIRIGDGDSVYDVLKRACKEKGIVVAAENTSLGIYVAGIDGFYEKDAGAQSGWKYKVNGKYPNDSAGDVKVKDGDSIEWVYVLKA